MAKKSNKQQEEKAVKTSKVKSPEVDETSKVENPEGESPEVKTPEAEAPEVSETKKTDEAEKAEEVKKEVKAEKTDDKTKVNDPSTATALEDKMMRLYPQYEKLWITKEGFVHPEGVAEAMRKGAKLFKNKYFNK